jgi:flavin-dependent dehydrogenase
VEWCEVLIVGGGPAGSTCAWMLRDAGLDVAIVDKASFPRDKVCAGWITPQVVEELRIDLRQYAAGRSLQPIVAFRIGIIGDDSAIQVRYERPVSFGIRRVEFDDYLLRRSRARIFPAASVERLRRSGRHWIVNDAIAAPMLVGAGGHFCPVGRLLNNMQITEAIVAAQEVEFRLDPSQGARFATLPGEPELYFCRDLAGYGWCLRKEAHLNIGFGRVDAHGLPADRMKFVRFLERTKRIPPAAIEGWRGHAYRLAGATNRRLVDDGVLLIGDAAGLAYPQSGEGIRPAVESGMLAAATILDCAGCYGRDRLDRYAQRVRSRFSPAAIARSVPRVMPAFVPIAVAPYLLRSVWAVRRFVLDAWFLHTNAPPLVSAA